MKLSMEVPTAYLRDLSPLCDFDFALAHKVLQDPEYASFYAGRPIGRELILDNSMHELGHPLSVAELNAAAQRVHADFVIAPDKLGQPTKNLEWFLQTQRAMRGRFKIGVTLCGRDPAERAAFLTNVQSADLLLLPYREARHEWYWEQQVPISRHWSRIHLLGVSTLQELSSWAPEEGEGLSITVDTMKPVKWGMLSRRLSTTESMRGCPISTVEALDKINLSCAQMEAVLWNTAYLRTFMV